MAEKKEKKERLDVLLVEQGIAESSLSFFSFFSAIIFSFKVIQLMCFLFPLHLTH